MKTWSNAVLPPPSYRPTVQYWRFLQVFVTQMNKHRLRNHSFASLGAVLRLVSVAYATSRHLLAGLVFSPITAASAPRYRSADELSNFLCAWGISSA